ncbi:MAG: head completion/stabilization protein [Rhodanobacter sp.]|nr:head completion/stabilization protein [Rhodanobacter sp.]
MSGLVATAPSIALDPISSGDWYPSIDPIDARAVMRVDSTVTNQRLIESIQNAMASVEDCLDEWQAQQVALGRAKLEDVPSKTIGGSTRLVLAYKRAVYATVQAELLERYRNFDTTATAAKRADTMDETVDDYRRNVRYAIRDILGRPRADAELI